MINITVIKVLSPEITLSTILSLRELKVIAPNTIKINPKIVLTTPIIGVLPILALRTLSKFSLISPVMTSLSSFKSISSSFKPLSLSFGVLIRNSSSIGFSSKLTAFLVSSSG